MSWALGYWVPEGERPAKPENASTLGFSDSLWGFTERCWSGEIESRPKVGEVVTHLREAAAERDEPMPPTLLSRSPPPSDDDDIFGELEIRLFLDITHRATAQINAIYRSRPKGNCPIDTGFSCHPPSPVFPRFISLLIIWVESSSYKIPWEIVPNFSPPPIQSLSLTCSHVGSLVPNETVKPPIH